MMRRPPRRAPSIASGARHPALWLALLGLLLSCRAGTVRRARTGPDNNHPAGVLSLLWRTEIHHHELFEPWPEECATGVVVGNRLVLGSRAGQVVGLDVRNGRKLFSTKLSGEVDGEAVFDQRHGHVLIGTDNGTLFAVDPRDGGVRWSWKAQGAIDQPPVVADDKIFVATSADKVYALGARDGALLWQYDRERPEGFAVHGYAAPRVHDGRVYAGFGDGFLVALRPDTGAVVWARSLASGSAEFVDVDTTPSFVGNSIVAGSYSGGLYGLRLLDGQEIWRLPLEGAGSPRLIDGTVFFVAPAEGLHAIDPATGLIRWRQGLPRAGDLTAPVAVGPYLAFSGSRTGLFLIDRNSGRLLQTFYPGRGMCAGPAVAPDASALYVLSNGGSVYALSVAH